MKQLLLLLTGVFFLTNSLHGQTTLDYALTESYNTSTSQYSNSEKDEYTYDANRNLIQTIYLNWNISLWETNQKEDNNYDTNGNKTQAILSNWNASTNQWENQNKDNYTFNANNQITQILNYTWNGSQWVSDQKFDITYLANNKFNQSLFYDWNGTQWVAKERGTASYTSNQLNTITYEIWDTNQWLIDEKDTYTINSSSGAIEEILYQSWNGSSWDNEDKESYQVDPNTNRQSIIYSYYNGSVWVLNDKTEYTYNTSILLNTLSHPFNEINYNIGIEDFPYFNKLLTSTNSSYNSDWEISTRTTYHYSDETASIDDFNHSSLKIYPNPTSNILKIDISNLASDYNIEIFNVIGNKVLSKKILKSNNQLNISNLQSGLYLIKIHINNAIITKRIIKQ